MADERTHAAPRRSRLRALRSAEAGFALIEVMVSAGLVMVIAAAVLGGIDVPSVLSGRNQATSVAASLAQKDQERLRSLPIATLVAGPLNQTLAPKVVDGHSYTVAEKVSWVTDSGTSVSCASGDTQSGDYLKLSSTVTAPSMRKPVLIESLLAPPNGSLASKKGNLGVLITNQAGDPAAGVPVTISGPASGSGTTDANGCVFFPLINPGSYTVKIQKTGWVDKNGANLVQQTSTVSSGATALLQQQYAPAASLTLNVETNAYGTVKPSVPKVSAMLASSYASNPITFAANATSQSVNSLFPFTDGYSAWVGPCAASQPVAPNGPYAATPLPGGSGTITIRQPAINLTLTINGAQPGIASFASFKSSAGSSCGYGGLGSKFSNLPLNTAGKLTADPGVPADTYDICVDGQVSGTWYRTIKTGVVVNNYANGTTVTLDGTLNSASQGQCTW
jgi:hypothetical protein